MGGQVYPPRDFENFSDFFLEKNDVLSLVKRGLPNKIETKGRRHWKEGTKLGYTFWGGLSEICKMAAWWGVKVGDIVFFSGSFMSLKRDFPT